MTCVLHVVICTETSCMQEYIILSVNPEISVHTSGTKGVSLRDRPFKQSLIKVCIYWYCYLVLNIY